MENQSRESPTYEGLPNITTFLSGFEALVIEPHRLSELDYVLKATPAKWWGMHKKSISEWPQCRILLEVRFCEEVTILIQRYIGLSNPIKHINQCRIAFAEYPQHEWVHHFIHTLEMTRSW